MNPSSSSSSSSLPEPPGRMRILFVIDSLGGSGAEHSTAATLPYLRDQGHVLLVSTLYDAGFGDEDRLRSEGFEITPLTSTAYPRRVRELRRRIREFRPDIIHTALFNSDMLGRPAGWRTGASVVSSLVNTPYDRARLQDGTLSPAKIRLVRMLDSTTARLFTHRLHAVSEGVAAANAAALHYPIDRIIVAERGRSREAMGVASAQRRHRVREGLGLGPRTKLVLAVGRQEHQKSHVDLIAAAGRLRSAEADIAVMIAGREGNATTAIRAALASNPAAAAVTTLLGHRHDVADLLVAADVLAISSLYEGTAGTAIEAMAMGCPVVCTDLTGIRGVLTHEENSILVAVGSPDALCAGLQRVLNDTALAHRLRTEGLIDFENRFTIEAAAARMETLYQNVLRARLGRNAR